MNKKELEDLKEAFLCMYQNRELLEDSDISNKEWKLIEKTHKLLREKV
jgi:hypothetical protein